MKALLFKEFKLAMHPICYVFIFIFPFMVFIPSYPIGVGFIYVLCCYPILFLGANKGQQTNDLLYSVLMPVRKKDIVLARVITIMILQIVFIIFTSLLLPFAKMVNDKLVEAATSAGGVAPEVPGLNRSAFTSVIGLALISYSVADLIFFSIYYKNGKSIVLSSLLTILVFTILIMFLTIVPVYVGPLKGFGDFLSGKISNQLIVLFVSLLIYIVVHYFVYKISAKRLEKVDF